MASRDAASGKACCMISELLEEAGIDRERVRKVRRQLLEGIILLCQWQLERMERPASTAAGKKARKVTVE
jgi:hypothetical protein